MVKIDNVKVAKAFEIIFEKEDFKSTIGNALSLLAHVVDVGERVNNKTPKRIECNIGIDSLSKGYRIVCEEIKKNQADFYSSPSDDYGQYSRPVSDLIECGACSGVGIHGHEPNTEHEIVCQNCKGTGQVKKNG